MAAVNLQHLSKTFRRGPAVLDDFSLEVADGELVVLFGPSGCGKTTLLRTIAGLEPLSAGSVSIGNRCVESPHTIPPVHIAPARRNVAMVFQNQALYPHLDVFANMAFGLKMRGTPQAEIRSRVNKIAELLGLMPLVERRPSQLSGGQRQRVALGRALVRRADVYLMDEPLSSLDGPLRDHLRREIHRLHDRQGTTMLWVTHQAEEAMALGDRIVVLRPPITRNGSPGGIQQIDTPQAIYQSPANRFVAAMIGRPGINIIRGTLQANGSQLDLHCDAFSVAGIGAIHPKLKTHAGQTVDVGLRPEDVALFSPQKQDSFPGPVIKGTVESVERLGCDGLLYVGGVAATIFETGFDTADGGSESPTSIVSSGAIVIRAADGRSSIPAKGEKVSLAVDPRKLLFFDGKNGQALAGGSACSSAVSQFN